MFTPTDVIAVVSAIGGSVYGALKVTAVDSYFFRLVVSLQSSIVFVLAFAYMEYLKPRGLPPEAIPGVEWTQYVLTTPFPVLGYLIILAILVIGIFHATVYIFNQRWPDLLGGRMFCATAVVCYVAIVSHALTLSIAPVDMGLI